MGSEPIHEIQENLHLGKVTIAKVQETNQWLGNVQKYVLTYATHKQYELLYYIFMVYSIYVSEITCMHVCQYKGKQIGLSSNWKKVTFEYVTCAAIYM